MKTPSQFTCPVCGSHCFGSSENGDGTRTYNCQEGPKGPCLFSVHEKSSAKYGICARPEDYQPGWLSR